jgi:hypothetical protein
MLIASMRRIAVVNLFSIGDLTSLDEKSAAVLSRHNDFC